MALKPPLIDARREADFAAQTRTLLCHYLAAQPHGWQPGDDGGEAGRALTGVFARYCSLVAERINQAPQKNFLAFLDLLGNALNPPVPAQAALSFAIDNAVSEGFTIVAGTQVQAGAPGGAGEPIVFETERDLWVTTFDLVAMSKAPINGTQEVDVTPLILHPARKVERIQPDERLFDQVETFYFGLFLAPGRAFPANRPVSLQMFIDHALYDPTSAAAASDDPARVVWEYGAGPAASRWKTLVVEDTTHGLTQAGTLDFLLPADFTSAQRRLFEKKLYWIRARLVGSAGGVYVPPPRLYGVALNTVGALQQVSLHDEVLGSCNGKAGQVFTAFKKPVLPGEVLEVLERPASAGNGADTAWTRWTQVRDFYASGPYDRHYVVNRQTGEFHFGDGRNGVIPPPGVRNVRLARYQTGGGRAGNVPANAINTLVAGNRRIAKVSNLAEAQGGAEAELPDALLDRAPRALRHRDRAVADEDYGDLAKLASPEVARALCVPLIDLARHPSKVISTMDDERSGAGAASVIIVPRTGAEKPLPSRVLLREVEAFLRQRCSPTATLSAVGPLYVRVDISVHVVLTAVRFDDQVKQQIGRLFAAFLHPLTGRDGAGWPFGRKPQASDFHRLLADLAGVDHVSSLSVRTRAEERPFDCPTGMDTLSCIEQTGRFLVCSGQHTITTATLP
jgi:predicted phage baseplate assembly protein